MAKKPTIEEIRVELYKAFEELKNSYSESPHTSSNRVSYLEINFCENLLNTLKAMEFHYRDDVPGMRVKRQWNKTLKRANDLIEKYGELSDESPHSDLQLKRKFDQQGYLEQRDFFKSMKNN